MKLKSQSKAVKKPSNKTITPEPPAAKTKKAAPAAGTEITAANFDKGLSYVGTKTPTVTIRKHAVTLAIGSLSKHGFIVVKGSKGVLIHAVNHNGDVYSRLVNEGDHVYGSIEAVKLTKAEGFKMEIVNLDTLKHHAKAIGKAATIVRQSDKAKFKGVWLADPGASYAPFLTTMKGKPVVLNTEPVRSYNKKPVQFVPEADQPFKAVLAEIAALK